MLKKVFKYNLIIAFFVIAILTLIIFVNACSNEQSAEKKKVITVSIAPLKYFTEKIAGNRFDIKVMLPPGASPATFDPTSRQIMELENSDLYFKAGNLPFEITWIGKFAKEFPKIKFINTSEGIKIIENGDDSQEHEFADPHVWTSPQNTKIIAKNIANALISLDPAGEQFYKENLIHFIKEIDSTDQYIRQKLDPLKQRSFIIYHPALTYFARDYNLHQISLESEGKEPSARHLSEIIAKAKFQNIRVIFIQKQFNIGEARTLEREINGKLITIDPLDYNWTRQMRTIANELSENTDRP